MSIAQTRRIVFETMVALSKGEVSIDHAHAMKGLAEADRHLAQEETKRLELAIANGYQPLDYTDAMEVISVLPEPQSEE